MDATAYHFIDHWRVEATLNEVADILLKSTDYPRWWPSTYLGLQVIYPGITNTDDRNKFGLDQSGLIHARGWLPYSLTFAYRCTEINYPHGFTVQVWGDLTGRGIWTFVQDGAWIDITYDWLVQADKPILREFSFLLKPLFRHNHTWSMQRGEASLKLELERRRAKTPEALAQIPAPLAPLNTTPFVLLGLAGVLLLRHGSKRQY